MKYQSYLFAILIFVFIVNITTKSNILDFQYSQYTRTLTPNNEPHAKFDFLPASIPSEKLQFPQACNILDMLNDTQSSKRTDITEADDEGYLNVIKSKFLNLLTLTQKLSNSQEKILHFQALINQTNPLPPKESQIIELQKFEVKLKNLTDRITTLDKQLQDSIAIIDAQNGKHHGGQAKRIELDYKIDWLKQKISYLRNFQQKALAAKQRLSPEIDYNQYFNEMDELFKKEQGLISRIDLIIQKKDKVHQLKKQALNLRASVAALELYITDIKECNTEKEKIRNEFKNHEKINQLIHELKALKKTEEPNIYCQGVVKKLTEKIRTMVRYYAIVASCASDLEPKLQDLARQKQKLLEVQELLATFQRIDNLGDFEKNYNEQKDEVKRMYSKVKEWKIREFIHDPQKIAEIRERAEGELLLISKQKSRIDEAKTGQAAVEIKTLSHNIIELIKKIRQLKYTYCGTYHKYDSLSNSLWSETYRYESEMNFKNSLWTAYNKERDYYNNLYDEMTVLRDQIYDKLR